LDVQLLPEYAVVLAGVIRVGCANADLRHYHQAAEALARADADWLRGMISRRVALEQAADVFAVCDDDLKVVIDLEDRG
jgi:hypothetical protein